MMFPNRMVMLVIPPIPMKAKLLRGAVHRASSWCSACAGATAWPTSRTSAAWSGGFLMILYWRGQRPFDPPALRPQRPQAAGRRRTVG